VGNYKYIFGSVPSRRFGRSLGIDLIPPKTCSLNCIFCQLGRTTQRTIVRKEFIPPVEVIAELKDWLKTDGKADYITLSGSGEPTLNSRFGDVLKYLGSLMRVGQIRAERKDTEIYYTAFNLREQGYAHV